MHSLENLVNKEQFSLESMKVLQESENTGLIHMSKYNLEVANITSHSTDTDFSI